MSWVSHFSLMPSASPAGCNDNHCTLTLDTGINQGDIDEYSQQVTQMRKIYENCRTVLVWLGPYNAANEADLATSSIQTSAPFVGEHSSLTFGDLGAFDPYSIEKALILGISAPNVFLYSSPPVWSALIWLFSHQYSTRVWAIQEVTANLPRIMHCGHHSVEWKGGALSRRA